MKATFNWGLLCPYKIGESFNLNGRQFAIENGVGNFSVYSIDDIKLVLDAGYKLQNVSGDDIKMVCVASKRTNADVWAMVEAIKTHNVVGVQGGNLVLVKGDAK